jgi:hypothetical protein
MATFRTVLQSTGGNNVGIVVPEETVQSFGRGKRVPVIVTIDGGYTYKTTIGVTGGRYLVSFNAETRKKTGRAAGDEVEVELSPTCRSTAAPLAASSPAGWSATGCGGRGCCGCQVVTRDPATNSAITGAIAFGLTACFWPGSSRRVAFGSTSASDRDACLRLG